MRALLKPPIGLSHVDEQDVELLARTGNDKIKVAFNKGEVRAVERWRLFAETDRRRRIADDEFARLPWQGKGIDPEGERELALRAERIEEPQ